MRSLQPKNENDVHLKNILNDDELKKKVKQFLKDFESQSSESDPARIVRNLIDSNRRNRRETEDYVESTAEFDYLRQNENDTIVLDDNDFEYNDTGDDVPFIEKESKYVSNFYIIQSFCIIEIYKSQNNYYLTLSFHGFKVHV